LGSSSALLGVAARETSTLYVLGDPGNQTVISYSAPTDRQAAFEAAAEQLLGTWRFLGDQ
jgi:hypothetical protein